MLGPKLFNRLRLDRVGKFASEIDRGRRNYLSVAVARYPRAGQALSQVRLAGPAGTVEHQGIVALGRLLEHGADSHFDEAVFGAGEKWAAIGAASTATPGESTAPGRGISTTPLTIRLHPLSRRPYYTGTARGIIAGANSRRSLMESVSPVRRIANPSHEAASRPCGVGLTSPLQDGLSIRPTNRPRGPMESVSPPSCKTDCQSVSRTALEALWSRSHLSVVRRIVNPSHEQPAKPCRLSLRESTAVIAVRSAAR